MSLGEDTTYFAHALYDDWHTALCLIVSCLQPLTNVGRLSVIWLRAPVIGTLCFDIAGFLLFRLTHRVCKILLCLYLMITGNVCQILLCLY